MGLKTSGETMQSLNNTSRRCAHVSAIFSPPGCALPKLGAGREAIVFTTRYVMQRGAKEGQTVGLGSRIMVPPRQEYVPLLILSARCPGARERSGFSPQHSSFPQGWW